MVNEFDIVAGKGFSFYVVDDLRSQKAAVIEFTTKSLNEALERFQTVMGDNGAVPALGVLAGLRFQDLLQKVHGENVLVRDYKYRINDWNEKMVTVMDQVCDCLMDENVVNLTYSLDFFDRIGKSCPVIVPLGNGDRGLDNGYCRDKRLKTISSFGFDAINQLYVNGHGWADYREILEDPAAFAEKGILRVEGVNVNYTNKTNLQGIDGQMDITPHDFSQMLQDINREFTLRVFDEKLGASYIVDSFDELKDAVKAWYELPAELTAHVEQQVGYGYQQYVFNGIDDDFEEIPYEQAAREYGFETGAVEEIIADAAGRVEKTAPGKSEIEIEKE